MATPTSYPGLLSQYGMDINPEDLRAQNLAKNQALSLGLVNNMGLGGDPAAQMAAQGGALFASALGQRGYKPTDVENRKMATANAAQTQIEKWLSENTGASAQDRADKYQEFLATEAFRNGLPDIGAPILQKLEDERAAKRRRDMELEKLGYEVDYTKRTQEASVSQALIKAGKEGVVEFYPANSRDPNASQSGVFDPKTGSVVGADGKVYKPGQWKSDRPQWDPLRTVTARGATSKGDKIGTAEAADIRNGQRATDALMRKTLEVDNLFNGAYTNGEGAAVMMGDVGKLTGFVNRWINTATDLAKAVSPDSKGAIGKITVKDDGGLLGSEKEYDLDSAADRRDYADKYKDEILSYLPSDLANRAEYADRYASLIVDLAYTTARAAEPGAKALTESDFKNAMKTIGGHLNDPTTLRKILFSRAMSANADLDFRFSQFSEEELTNLVGTESRKKYKGNLDEVNRRLKYLSDTGEPVGTSYPKGARRGATSPVMIKYLGSE